MLDPNTLSILFTSIAKWQCVGTTQRGYGTENSNGIRSLAVVNDLLLEVDHLVVYVSEGSTSVSVLQEFGLHCSSRRVKRPEQGTASQIIFFENAYLELIWVENERAVEEYAARTGIDILRRTRWQHSRASPFGVGLRCESGTADQRKYWVEWMRSRTYINLAAENLAKEEEPICFVIPDSIALTTWLDRSLEAHRQLISHPLGVRTLTGVKITLNSDKELTNAVALLDRNSIVAIERGTTPLLELTFDGGTKGKILNARPMLPILLRY